MRRFAKISALAILISILLLIVPVSANTATAAEESSNTTTGGALKLEESYPHIDGSETHMPVQNVGIKLYFSENVSTKELRDANADCFLLTNSIGVKVPIKLYYSNKENDSNYILVTAQPENGTLEPKSGYKLTISKDLKSKTGNVLGVNAVIQFQTVDTAGNTKVYMLLMVVMVVCMVGFSFISKRRKAKVAAATGVKEKVVNPYELAKEKKISVKEAIALIEKDKQKRAKQLSLAENTRKKAEEKKAAEDGRKHVKGARPVSAGGSSYKTGRKALAEKKAKEDAARRAKGTTHPKKGKGGKKKR